MNNKISLGRSDREFVIEYLPDRLGKSVTLSIPYNPGSIPSYDPNDEFIVTLKGQRIPVFVEKVQYETSSREYVVKLTCNSRETKLAAKSFTKGLEFLSLTKSETAKFQTEWDKVAQKTYCPLIISNCDEYGRGGWSAVSIIERLAAYMGLSVVCNIYPYWVKQVRIPEGIPFIDAIIDLAAVFEPFITVDAGTLFVLDIARGYGGNITIKKGRMVSENEEYSVTPPRVTVEGHEGPFDLNYAEYTHYNSSHKHVKISLYGLDFYISSYGDLIEETNAIMSHEKADDVEEGELFILQYEKVKFYRAIYGEKGERVYRKNIKWALRKVIIDVPGDGDFVEWSLTTALEDAWSEIMDALGVVNADDMQKEFIIEDVIIDEEVNYWHCSTYHFENPRQDSTLPTAEQFTGLYKPVNVRVRSQFCYFDSDIDTRIWLPLARVEFDYKWYTDTLFDDTENGIPYGDQTDVYGPICLLEEDGAPTETTRSLQRYQALCETKENAPAEGTDLIPEEPDLCDDIPTLVVTLYQARGCIESRSITLTEEPDSEHYKENTWIKGIGNDGRWGVAHFDTKTIHAPLPRNPTELRKQRIQISSNDTAAIADAPPLYVNLQVIDWLDAARVLSNVKRKASRGKITRQYVLPYILPVEPGWGVTLAGQTGPGGAILKDRTTFKGMIKSFQITREGTTAETSIFVRGEETD